MNSNRRRAILTALATAMTTAVALPARAEAYPDRPIRLVVPFAAGGGTDTLARLLARQLSTRLVQPVTVDNLTGAAGTVGAAQVARSSADGYELLFGASVTNAIAPALYKGLSYDSVNDFAPVGQVATFGTALYVDPALPIHNVRELVAWSKGPGKGGAYGTWGIGTVGHLAMAMLNSTSGTSMVHVPYKGTAPALNDVLGRQLPAAVGDVIVVAPFYKSGRVRVIAVTGSRRSPTMPEIPTLAEQGIPFSTDSWYAVFVPAKTLPPVLAVLRKALNQVMSDPSFRKSLTDLGMVGSTLTLPEFESVRRADVDTWASLVKLSGAKAE